MNADDLLAVISRGEDGKHQFKVKVTNAQSLSEELVAFSNAGGGMILIGVNDDGTISGLTQQDIRRLNILVNNTSTNNVRPPSIFTQKMFLHRMVSIWSFLSLKE